MKVRFNGMFARKSKNNGGGCGCHGSSVSGLGFITHKTFVLPSGAVRDFSMGEEYEVSDLDGNFLLSYTRIDKNGLMQSAFTRLN